MDQLRFARGRQGDLTRARLGALYFLGPKSPQPAAVNGLETQ